MELRVMPLRTELERGVGVKDAATDEEEVFARAFRQQAVDVKGNAFVRSR